MRPRRPARAVFEQAIRETGGSMTKLALRLGVSRTTAYTWVYQAGLDRLVGITPAPTLEELTASAPTKPEDARPLLPPPPAATSLVPVTVRVDAALWRRTRIRALEEDRPAGAVVGDALCAYLAGAKVRP